MDASRGPYGLPGITEEWFMPGPPDLAGMPELAGPPGAPGPPGPPGAPGESLDLPLVDVSPVPRKWLDVPYATLSAAQRSDIYLPDDGDGPFPVILHVHGGGFGIGDKRDFHIVPYLWALERGYAVVSINYRLSGEAGFPAGLQDVKAAVRWLRAHAREYALDGERIAACGGSSGGNYVAMLCTTSEVSLFDDPSLGNLGYSCAVQAGVDLFGPTDFLKMDEQLVANGLGPVDHSQPWSPESVYLGAPIAEVPERVKLASPITWVHAGMPPLLIQHGRSDFLVPFQQSVDLARAIEGRVGDGRCELDILEGVAHDGPAFYTDENLARIFGFVDRFLM